MAFTDFQQFRLAAKMYIVLMIPVIGAYMYATMTKLVKTDGEKNYIAPMSETLYVLKRVVEVDMMYTYVVNYIAISLSSMYLFLFIIQLGAIANTFLLTHAYQKNNRQLRKIGRLINVVITSLAFLNILFNKNIADFTTTPTEAIVDNSSSSS